MIHEVSGIQFKTIYLEVTFVRASELAKKTTLILLLLYFISARSGNTLMIFIFRTSTSLKQLEALYVTRCHHIWRDPDLLAWLESNAHAVLGRVDEEDSEVGDLRSKVETWYKAATPRNILRHLILSDLKEVPINLLVST